MANNQNLNIAAGVVAGFALANVLPGIITSLTKPKKQKMQLKYFNIPALGEPIRLLLELGSFDWEDQRVEFSEWSNIKPSTKWGQMPVLSVDGQELSQTKAICRLLAKQVTLQGSGSPLYPADAMTAFCVDELIDVFEDVRMKLVPTFKLEAGAKEAARAALFAADGDATKLLNKIDSLIVDDYLVGSRVSLADVWAFYFLNFLRCGFWDGLPADYLDQHPKLAGIVAKVSAIPAIRAYYTSMAEKDAKYTCFAN